MQRGAYSIPQLPVDIGPVHRRVTSSAPTASAAQEIGVRLIADVNLPCGGHDLRMALEAKIVVPLDEHLVRDRAVRLMTNRAAFPQGLVPINELARLFAMTFGAGLIDARHANRSPHAKR